MPMADHVPRERLYEIAHGSELSQQPEWPHIRKCDVCRSQLLEFVLDLVRADEELKKTLQETMEDPLPKEESADDEKTNGRF